MRIIAVAFFSFTLFCSCGKKSKQDSELLQLNEYLQKTYEIYYQGLDGSYHFEGEVVLAGAGLHLRITSRDLQSGYLFFVLHNAPNCQQIGDSQRMWNLNSDFIKNDAFENGLTFQDGRIKKSFDYYLLMRFLRTPKKDYYTLREGEKLALEMRTLLFYYSNTTIVEADNLILMGCAEFHSA